MTEKDLAIQNLRKKLSLALQDISKKCFNCYYEEYCKKYSQDIDSMSRFVSCGVERNNWEWKYSK